MFVRLAMAKLDQLEHGLIGICYCSIAKLRNAFNSDAANIKNVYKNIHTQFSDRHLLIPCHYNMTNEHKHNLSA